MGEVICLLHVISRSVSVKNFAVSGKSERMKNDAAAQTIVNSPSRINIQAHPGLPPTPSILDIAAARKPPEKESIRLTRIGRDE